MPLLYLIVYCNQSVQVVNRHDGDIINQYRLQKEYKNGPEKKKIQVHYSQGRLF